MTTARVSALTAQIAMLGSIGAMLGIATVVAIGGVIFGPGAGEAQLNAPGGNVLTITADPAAPNTALTDADVDAIARSVPDIAALSRAVSGIASVGAGGEDGQISVHGVDPSFVHVTRDTVAQGTFFTAQDAASASRVAVLGQALSSQLFKNPQTAIGSTIRIRNVPFTVIGVLATQTRAVSDTTDDAVLIPFQTGQVRLFGRNALDAVLVQVVDPRQAELISQDVEQLLRQRHQVRAGQPDGFTIRTSGRFSAAGSGGAASQFIGQVLTQARQYSCEAKGLCSSAQTLNPAAA